MESSSIVKEIKEVYRGGGYNVERVISSTQSMETDPTAMEAKTTTRLLKMSLVSDWAALVVLPPRGPPSERPPAAWTAPLRNDWPHLVWTALYNAGWLLKRELCARPGAYGASDSNAIHELRIWRVQVVQREAAGKEGWRRRNAMLLLVQVAWFGEYAWVVLVPRRLRLVDS
jgi:hypothetical protein